MRLWHHFDSGIRRSFARLLCALRSDRGDSPVPTAIIIVGLAILAVGVLVMAQSAIESWEGIIPDAGIPAGDAP